MGWRHPTEPTEAVHLLLLTCKATAMPRADANMATQTMGPQNAVFDIGDCGDGAEDEDQGKRFITWLQSEGSLNESIVVELWERTTSAPVALCEFPDEYCPDAGTGRWKNLGVLGSGGLAVVYLAQDMKGSRGRVALKVLRAAAQPVHAYELHREALWSLTRLHCISHSKYDSNGSQLFVRYLEDHTGLDKLCIQDGIATSFDQRRRHLEADSFDWSALATQKASQRPYVVMEHLPGQMLWDLTCTRARSIKKLKPLSDEETRQILVQLSKAVLRRLRLACTSNATAWSIAISGPAMFRPRNDIVGLRLCRRRPRCQVKVLDLGVMLAAEPSLRLSASPAVCVFRNRTLQDGYDWLPPEASYPPSYLSFY
ncbi:hypothetical protein AK812_SmicGene12198 [Symbiodinium microadriaticum]|uniref:Protein kinase domain-containing protein n=1 Tax=Symbiodinium microadriaticum TaxID=2951 RepID=A0A1Q9EB77_SYMMI|nr:hypothetical protein AK812_SmicGene12198 [Symbiodinium microadriaticum]